MKDANTETIYGRWARLTVMETAYELILKAIERPRHLPGLVVLYGHSGLGKTTAAAFVSAETNAVHVEVRSTWTTKYFLQKLAQELGVETAGTIPALEERVAAAMAMQDRPLIVDEADFALRRGYIEILRDLYEMSRAPVMLIGEEYLLDNLRRWERVHNRILAHGRAEPVTIDDARALRDLYCHRVRIEDDLIAHFVERVRGGPRRIAINLENAQQIALAEGREAIDRAAWGDRPVMTGDVAHRRVAS